MPAKDKASSNKWMKEEPWDHWGATNFYRMNGQKFQGEGLKDGERCQGVGGYLKKAQDIKRPRS